MSKRFPQESGSIDGILCWDVFDYLDKTSAKKLAEQLTRILKPEGVLLAFFVTAEPQPGAKPEYTRHVVVNQTTLQHRPYPAARGKQRPMPNRDIQRMFEELRITEQFLLKSNLREVLFRKPAETPPSVPAGHSLMLDFDLTDEQRLLEQSVREWAGREVAPRIRELDRAHRFDRGILPQMAKLGLLGISVPAEYGGAGMDYVCLGLASEELEYVDTSLRVIMSVHAGLNCLTLLSWGTEDQKQRYLVPQAQGTKIATYGLTEPSAGSDARAHSDGRDQEGRSLSPDRREDVDLARRRRRQLSRVRVERSGEEEAARSVRA